MKPLACSFQSWRRTAAGFAGAERALLICVALAIVLAVGVLVRGGSDQAAGDASRTLAAAGSGLGDIGRGGLVTGMGHFPAAGPLGGAAGVSGTVQANSGASGGGGGILGTIGSFFSGVGHVAKTALHVGLDVVASAAYAPYYFSHAALQGLNHLGDHLGPVGTVVSRVIGAPLVPFEALGLGGDVAIDWIKGHTVDQESVADEGKPGYINPFHSYVPGWLKGPEIYLPGVHPNGHVDWEW